MPSKASAPSTPASAVEKLYAAETEALRKAELALTRQQLSDAVFEPFRDLVKQHRRLLRQSMKLTSLSDSTQLQLRRTTRQLSEALKQVQELNAELKSLQRERNELVAMTVHDLKSPLTGICGLAGFLADGSSKPGEQVEFGREILQLGEGMLGMIADLVDLYRYENSTLTLSPTETPLKALAARLLSEIEPSARRKRIRLSVSADESAPAIDPEVLLRIAGNLISNAIKFSPAGSSVDVKLECPGDRLLLTVSDHGPGISPEDQKKLFQKFMRLSARPTGGEHSSGLGLAIVKRLVDACAGTVTCESQLGSGARFLVELPTAST